MLTFRENDDLKAAIRTLFEAKKITAVFCRGVAALVDCKLADGSYLVEGKTVSQTSRKTFPMRL